MAKNSIDVYGASGKTNALKFDPENLHLVTDKSHPLYDERVHLPIDEGMVLNIKELGVLEPIIVWKDPETGLTCVVVGRQRVKHTIEANKLLLKEGKDPLFVPGVVKRGSANQMAKYMVSENEIRRPDTPLGGYVANAEGILGLHSTPLYRHAQQPLVPDNRAITQHFDTIALETAREILCDVNRRHEFLGGEVQLLSRIQCRIDAACRAAILQAQSDDDGEPTDDERIMAIEGIHNCERCGDEGWVMGEMGITRCACGQAGNSPVIGIDLASGPDRTVEVRYVAPPGYVMVPKEPTETMINAWLSEVANWRGHVAGYKAMLAVAPQEVK